MFESVQARFYKMMLICFLPLVFVVCGAFQCGSRSSCTPKDVSAAYLDVARDLITRAMHTLPSDFGNPECPECPNDCSKMKAADCADLFNMGKNKSGVYEVWPMNRRMQEQPIKVYCDMDTDGGGWTVIQRRGDFGSKIDYFYKDWKSYKEGFGWIEIDFWLGNDYIYFLTNQKPYSVRFDLLDIENNSSYAHYEDFWIDDELHNYTLHISNYSGDAGDAMSHHNKMAFTTKDRDNDLFSRNCAVDKKGAWWYKKCGRANLNGLYRKGEHPGKWDGIFWQPWKGLIESLQWCEIKLRPKSFEA